MAERFGYKLSEDVMIDADPTTPTEQQDAYMITIGSHPIETEAQDVQSSGVNASSLPSDNWELEIDKYRDKMPPDMKIPNIDVLILYAEDDKKIAREFQRHLIDEKEIGPNGPVRAELYDGEMMISLEGTQFGHLEKAYKKSTFIFLLMTKSFVEDEWVTFSSQSCLMDSINNKEKSWCVVPVYTVKRSETLSFEKPFALISLKGITYFSESKSCSDGVAKLIREKVYVRLDKEEKLKTEQKQWIENNETKPKQHVSQTSSPAGNFITMTRELSSAPKAIVKIENINQPTQEPLSTESLSLQASSQEKSQKPVMSQPNETKEDLKNKPNMAGDANSYESIKPNMTDEAKIKSSPKREQNSHLPQLQQQQSLSKDQDLSIDHVSFSLDSLESDSDYHSTRTNPSPAGDMATKIFEIQDKTSLPKMQSKDKTCQNAEIVNTLEKSPTSPVIDTVDQAVYQSTTEKNPIVRGERSDPEGAITTYSVSEESGAQETSMTAMVLGSFSSLYDYFARSELAYK